MAKFKKLKGISIVYIVLITSIIFVIALGVNSISYRQAKSMNEIGFSTVAFFAADAGAERQMFNLYQETPIVSSFSIIFDSSAPASASTSVRCSATTLVADCIVPEGPDSNCLAQNICVSSVGDFKNIKRAVQLEY